MQRFSKIVKCGNEGIEEFAGGPNLVDDESNKTLGGWKAEGLRAPITVKTSNAGTSIG